MKINGILLLLITFYLYINSDISAQWNIQESGVTVDLWDVCFIDTLNGWAVGDSTTIINTTDGGISWEIQYAPLDSIRLEEVQFLNKLVGYTVGESGIILGTKNGGITWAIQESGVPHDLKDISFVNENIGWIVGRYNGGGDLSKRGGVILVTKNGGSTWHKQVETAYGISPDADLFTAVQFLNSQDGWMLGSGYWDNFDATNLYRTTNGGMDWTIVGKTDSPMWELSLMSPDTIWVGGYVFGKSYDGGVNWEYNSFRNPEDTIYQYPGHTVRDFVQVTCLIGWITVTRYLGKGEIYFTSDGGMNWEKEGIPDIPKVLALSKNFNGILWAVGNNGTILNYKDDINSILVDLISGNEIYKLFSCYPNPFNPTTRISYSLPKISNVSLVIYDMMGREIKAFEKTGLSAGVHSFVWDGTNNNGALVTSGIYISKFRAISEDGSSEVYEKSGKLMLLK